MTQEIRLRNIRLLIAFDGSDYHGWQIQPDAPTIQGEIERHLGTIHNRHITLHGAGRTDAGVHALGMVAHFHTDKKISPYAFLKGLNSMLPSSIRILDAKEESPSFHSRFSSIGKTYIYSIYNGSIMLPQNRLYSVHIFSKLDLEKMETCLNHIIGTHDFGCFETAGSRDPDAPDGKGSTRTISKATISTSDNHNICVSITGDGFLRHMVRNIVGTLLEVGLGRRTVQGFVSALNSKKRSQAGSTAPAHGLTLKKIYY